MAARPNVFPAPAQNGSAIPVVDAAKKVVRELRQAGFEAFFAGGFARDILINRPVHDIDIATNAHPDRVVSLFPGSRGFGKSFGVIQVEMDGFMFEVATFRQDKGYQDGRRPDAVVFTTASEDASRRDFTVNGMFYDPVSHMITDYVEGKKDIESRLIRAIGSPTLRFQEDHLRLMRAVRFSAVLEFDIEPETLKSIQMLAHKLESISMERIRGEMMRIFMESPRPGDALELLNTTGILPVILPEVRNLMGVEQPPEFHPEGDVYQHVKLMLNSMKERSPKLIWSILMHDIAKPATFAIGTNRDGKSVIQFRGHAEKGAEMAESIMKRFRCSNDETDDVKIAVLNHMRFISVPEMKNSTLRKWVGSPTFPLELELHRIDCLGCHRNLDHYEQINDFQKKLREEPVLPVPLLRGQDLLTAGFTSGPAMGKILKLIYDAQLEGTFSTRDEALDWLNANRSSLADINK